MDSTRISDDGSFSIKLPFPVPPDSILKTFSAEGDSNQYSVERDERIFSNPNSKYTKLRLKGYGTPKALAFYLYAQNKSPITDSIHSIGDYRVEYYYFSENTTITGSYTITLIDPYGTYKLYTTSYNLCISSGWNTIKTRITFNDGQTCIYEVTSEDVLNKKWFVASYILDGFVYVPSL